MHLLPTRSRRLFIPCYLFGAQDSRTRTHPQTIHLRLPCHCFPSSSRLLLALMSSDHRSFETGSNLIPDKDEACILAIILRPCLQSKRGPQPHSCSYRVTCFCPGFQASSSTASATRNLSNCSTLPFVLCLAAHGAVRGSCKAPPSPSPHLPHALMPSLRVSPPLQFSRCTRIRRV